jgi:hypothetical protein
VFEMVSKDPEHESDAAMEEADEANGEGRRDEGSANDTESRYGHDESPA